MVKLKIIIDGSNSAFCRRNHQKKAKIKNLQILIEYLEELKKKHSIEYEIIIDANLRYRIDKKEELEQLYKIGLVIQCPNKIKADDFIIEYYRRHPANTIILSNDNFTDYSDVHPNIFKFIIMFDEVIFQPDLTKFLECAINLKEGCKANVQSF